MNPDERIEHLEYANKILRADLESARNFLVAAVAQAGGKMEIPEDYIYRMQQNEVLEIWLNENNRSFGLRLREDASSDPRLESLVYSI